MNSKGISLKETLLALGVVVVAASLLLMVMGRMRVKEENTRDVERMRHLYISLAMYETDLGGYLPSDLAKAQAYVPSDLVYGSITDPFIDTKAAKYPVDAGLPDWNVTAPQRISFTYLYAFAAAKKTTVKPWYELKYDPKVGLIADEWTGTVVPGSRFTAIVSGQIMRLNTDGALHVIQGSANRDLGNFQELFFKTEK